jgi:hypothetical protein
VAAPVNGWMIAGVIASFLASVVALSIAGWGERNRRRGERIVQLTNARSVVTIAHPYEPDGPAVEVLNGSPAPILEVRIIRGDVYDGRRTVGWYMHHTASGVTAILPGASSRLPGYWMTDQGSPLAFAAIHGIHYVIQWTDTRGQRWERDGTGTPREVGPPRGEHARGGQGAAETSAEEVCDRW